MAASVTVRSRGGRLAGPLAGIALAGACVACLSGSAYAAPDGRAYELVSPADKGNGGVVWGHRSSADGDALALLLNSAPSANGNSWGLSPYVARRTGQGWAGRSAAPPVVVEHRGIGGLRGNALDWSDDLSRVLLYTNDRFDPADGEPIEEGTAEGGFDVYRYDIGSGAVDWLSRPLPAFAANVRPGHVSTYVGRSADESTYVFRSRELTDDQLPGDNNVLHAWRDGALQPVSIIGGVVVSAELATGVSLPLQVPPGRNQSISADGSRIIFQALGIGLQMRENGAVTIPVSASQRSGSEGESNFSTRLLGSSEDLGTVWFWSEGQLTDDAAASGGVYRWDRDGEQLSFIAPLAVDTVSSTEYAVATDDASRIYFTSMSAPDGSMAPQRNLYLLENDEVRLVASPGNGDPTFMGVAPGLRLSRDGRYAVFTSGLNLTDGDLGGFGGVYLYDAESGALRCASCRGDGEPSTANAVLRSEDQAYTALASSAVNEPRTVTWDGRVVFQTSESLSPTDVNDRADVYMYDPATGRQTLISPGIGELSFVVDNSEDGSTVFFLTANSLVARDTDGYPDIYAARVGGGFPADAVAPEACRGDDCQGNPTPQPNAPLPPSTLLDGPAQEDDPLPPAQRPQTLRLTRPGRAAVRALARSGSTTVAIRVTRSGAVSLVARARIGRRSRVVANARRGANPGTVRVPLRLNRMARRQLASGRALRLTVTVRQGSLSRRFTLRVPAGRGR